MSPESTYTQKKRKAFYKTDFAKMGGSALVTAFAFIIYNNVASNNLFDLRSSSESISYDNMQTLQNEYNSYRTILKVPNPANPGSSTKLKGFRFEASDLNEIINNNKVLDQTTHLPVEPKYVVFYFGKLGTTPDGLLSRFPNIHIIAVGMDAANNPIIPSLPADQADKTKSSIKDKADPCPGPNCP